MAAREGKKHDFDDLTYDELVTLIKSIRAFNDEDCSFIGLFQHENKRAPNEEEMLKYLDDEKIYEDDKYLHLFCGYPPYKHLLGGNPGCTGCDHFNEHREFEPRYNISSPEENCEERSKQLKEEEQRKRKEEEQRKRKEEEERKRKENVPKIKEQTLREGECPVLFEGVDKLEISNLCGHGLSKEAREQLTYSKCPMCQIPGAFSKGNTETHYTSQGKIKRVADNLSSLAERKGRRTGIFGQFADSIGLGGKKTRRRRRQNKKGKTKRATRKTKSKKSRKNKSKRK